MLSQSSHRWTVHILLFVIVSAPMWSVTFNFVRCIFTFRVSPVGIIAVLICLSVFVCIVGISVSQRYHFLISWFFYVSGTWRDRCHGHHESWYWRLINLMCCEYIHTVSGSCLHCFVAWWPCMLFSVIVRCLVPIVMIWSQVLAI